MKHPDDLLRREFFVGADISSTIQLGQVQEIGSIGFAGLVRVLCVVHAVAQVLVVEIFIPMGQTESMANFVAASIKFLSIAFRVEIKLIEFCPGADDSSVTNTVKMDLVDATPLSISIVAEEKWEIKIIELENQ